MSDRSPVEQELMNSCKFKSKNYPDRQDELAALVRAVERAPQEVFDNLSDEAADWYNRAATAMNDHDDIPDFEETSDDVDHEADEAAEDDLDEVNSEDDGAGSEEDDVNEGSIEEDEADEKPKPKSKPVAGKSSRKAAREDDDADDGVDETPKKPKGKKAKAKAEEPTDTASEDSADNVQPIPPHKLKKPKESNKHTPYDDITGEKDRFGLYYGTKTQKAVEIYCRPEGASVKDVEQELAGKYRNILKRLEKEGHRVEKFEKGIYKVTHKDDVGKDAKQKKGKKQ